MTTARRGLSLLEVLLASVILATLTGTCAPLLSSALRTMAAPSPESQNEAQALRFDLGRMADKFMSDPAAFGCKDLVKETEIGPLTIDWPKEFSDRTWPSAAVQRLPTSNDKVDHCWLIFECGGINVQRYLAFPKPKEPVAP